MMTQEWNILFESEFWRYPSWMSMSNAEFEQLNQLVTAIAKYTIDKQLHVVDGVRECLGDPKQIIEHVDALTAQNVSDDVVGTILMILYMCMNWGYEHYTDYTDIVPALDQFGIWDWCAITHMTIGPNNNRWMRRELKYWQQDHGYIPTDDDVAQ